MYAKALKKKARCDVHVLYGAQVLQLQFKFTLFAIITKITLHVLTNWDYNAHEINVTTSYFKLCLHVLS